MVEKDDTLILNYAKEEENIRTYKCYVQYEPNKNEINGIKRYCCNCAKDNRTIGCCSHVAVLIYYVSHERFLSRIIKPSDHLTSLFDMNDVVPIKNEDSDED